VPEWVVHFYTGEYFCGIPWNVNVEVTRAIDAIGTKYHDVNRIIEKGQWKPDALLPLAFVVYKKWGYEGLRAMLHHHVLLDYSKTLTSSGFYGWQIRRLGPTYVKDILGFVNSVLNEIVNDFKPILKKIEQGGDLYSVIQVAEEKWNTYIQHPDDVLKAFRDPEIRDVLKNLLSAVESLRDCMVTSVLEVSWLTWINQWKNEDVSVCPVCRNPILAVDDAVMIPSDYVKRGIAYRVHGTCLARLMSEVEELARGGLNRDEIFRKLVLDVPVPPSTAYEVLKAKALIKQVERIPLILVAEGIGDITEQPLLIDEKLEDEWRKIRKEAIARAVKENKNTSLGAIMAQCIQSSFLPCPSQARSLYNVLHRVIEASKPSIVELLRVGKKEEALEKLTKIASRIFENPWIIAFPPEAYAGINRVYLTPTAIAGLARICELYGIKINVKTEWFQREILELIKKIQDAEVREGEWEKIQGKEWIDTLKELIE
jgi:hypothetical protein